MSDEFFSIEEQEFDLASLTQWDTTHTELVGKTLMLESIESVDTQYGQALIARCKIITGVTSFDDPSISVLIGAQVLVSALTGIKNPQYIALTIGKATPKDGGQEYYMAVKTPPALKTLIHVYRVQKYKESLSPTYGKLDSYAELFDNKD